MMKNLLAIALFSGVLATSVSATPLFGTFTLDGTVIVTSSGLIEWVSNTSVPSQATVSSGGLSGSFVGLANQTVDINTLTDAPGQQPVGVPFTAFNFISFPSDPLFPTLQATFFSLGSGSAIQCSTNAALAAPNQTCTLTSTTTPPVPGGSPFTFLNTTNGTGGCCSSSATWNLSGVTSDGLSNWSGLFNATFNEPFQTVLANFVTNGQETDAYSGAFTVTISPPVPEPSTYVLMGSGLALLMLGRHRFGAKRKN